MVFGLLLWRQPFFFLFQKCGGSGSGLIPKQTGSERLAIKKEEERETASVAENDGVRSCPRMLMWRVATALDARDCINALTFHSALFCQLVAARAFTASPASVALLAFVPSLSMGGPQH